MRPAAWLVAACLLAALGSAGCFAGDGPSGDAREGGSIVVGTSVFPAGFDPALARDPRALELLWLVYTPLLTYRHAEGQDGTQPVPGLARALPKVSDDGLTYVLRLRRGLRYSNGVPVRAGDFERAVNRVRALHSPLAPLYATIASIDADARTGRIRVSLTRPDPTFAHVLALPSSAPLPRGTPSKDLGARPPPGVGPYRIAGVRKGARVHLRRRPDFHLTGVPAGHVDTITLTRAGSPARQASEVITGSVDLMQEPAPTDLLPEIRSKYRDRYRDDVAAATVALIPDPNAPPFEDATVRGAVSEALDGEKLVRLYQGLLQSSCNLVPEVVSGYRALDPCPHGDRDEPPDLAGAQEAIERAAAAGAPVSVRPGPGVPAPVSRYVVDVLRKIGFRATLLGRVGARLRLRRIAPPVAHPAAFLEPFTRRTFDLRLSEAVAAGTVATSEGKDAGDAWAAADERIVTEGYAAPLGFERRPSFFSERIDTDNCVRTHPIFGVDLSSLCLR